MIVLALQWEDRRNWENWMRNDENRKLWKILNYEKNREEQKRMSMACTHRVIAPSQITHHFTLQHPQIIWFYFENYWTTRNLTPSLQRHQQVSANNNYHLKIHSRHGCMVIHIHSHHTIHSVSGSDMASTNHKRNWNFISSQSFNQTLTSSPSSLFKKNNENSGFTCGAINSQRNWKQMTDSESARKIGHDRWTSHIFGWRIDDSKTATNSQSKKEQGKNEPVHHTINMHQNSTSTETYSYNIIVIITHVTPG